MLVGYCRRGSGDVDNFGLELKRVIEVVYLTWDQGVEEKPQDLSFVVYLHVHPWLYKNLGRLWFRPNLKRPAFQRYIPGISAFLLRNKDMLKWRWADVHKKCGMTTWYN